MARHLCFDIGNTRVKYGLFDNREILLTGATYDTFDLTLIQRLEKEFDFDKVIACSTKLESDKVRQEIKKHYDYTDFTTTTPLPISNGYGTPLTLGEDRLAAAVGAYRVADHNKNFITIDAGTCITYDVVSNAEFLGGNISPGLRIRAKSMNDYTDNLPEVTPKYHSDGIGRNTHQALENGVVWGALFEINSYIEYVTEKIGTVNVYLTGGDGDFLAKHIKTKIFARPFLVLEGLDETLYYNA